MNPITWFARNRVAANLIMVIAVAGGMVTIFGLPLPFLPEQARVSSIKQEVFPEFSLDLITVAVEYRGAAPQEVEEGVCVKIEESIQGLDGIKEITSVAAEGVGMVTIKLIVGSDTRKVLEDIKTRIDAIDTFPEETEETGGHRADQPARGDRRRGLRRCRRGDGPSAGRADSRRPGGASRNHAGPAGQRATLRDLGRGFRARVATSRVDVRSGRGCRASIEPRSAGRLRQDSRRRGSSASQGPGLPARPNSRTSCFSPDRTERTCGSARVATP